MCAVSDEAFTQGDVPAPKGAAIDAAELERHAIGIAQRGADLVRTRLGGAVSLRAKSSPTDVVTQTDLDVEMLIRRSLLEVTPDAGIIGEEEGARSSSATLQWIVDPLDGTVNFLYGLPVCAVSIAAARDGAVIAGAVADVLRGEMFSACAGGGARLDGRPIAARDGASLADALVTTGFSYRAEMRERQGRVFQRLLPNVRDIRCFGSAALQLCWVGAGRVDAYFERDTKLWDYAAGALVAREAGAQT